MDKKNELFLKDLRCIAQKAGQAILGYYQQDIEFERKADQSPVTEADLAAHHVIVGELHQLDATTPIISEEQESHVLPEGAEDFWLVDPLDGTKSFIRKEGQFTVNIGLIEKGRPTIGVIYIPVEGVMYWGAEGLGAFRQKDGEAVEPISTRTPKDDGLTAVVSLSHLDPKTQAFLEPYEIVSRVSAASSLKFCRVAEGAADIYPRFGPTMEWDTAAGHAIVEAAGGRVENPDGSAFTYRKDTFRNGPFVAWGK